ncbi:MAG: RES family NAD+ phosphorylase [Sedimenticola sp.]
MHVIRDDIYEYLPDPEDWSPSQVFGSDMKAGGLMGLVYRSVRQPGGECIPALRPPAVSIPVQGPHLSYAWNGTEISAVFEKTQIA